MKRVYVAGAYSANNVIDVLKNIGRGEQYSAEIFFRGMAPFCPWHDKQYAMYLCYEDVPVTQYYEYSIAWLKVSDAMFLVPGWKNSEGTLKEIEIAKSLNIPIFKLLIELTIWNDTTPD
jgi:hypothetical protein